MTLQEMLNERVGQCEIFSNMIRTLIALIVLNLEDTSWAEIKNCIENIMGPINPNTLSFHLNKLILNGLIKKTGTDEQPRYVSTEKNIKELNMKVGQDLTILVKEWIEKE